MLNNSILKMVVYVLGTFVIITVFLSSILNLYIERDRIVEKARLLLPVEQKPYIPESDIYWANKIMEGGYLLHFRHAEREKWIDVTMYDAMEADLHDNGPNESRYAENDYFTKAVCLNERGLVQARAIGENLAHIGLPIGYVATSPSCRARQTAEIVFGGYDKQHRLLVHRGPWLEDKPELFKSLTDFYLTVPMESGTNTIVSAHDSVVNCEMLENCSGERLRLEEGGFFVLTRKDGKLYLEHEFHNYNYFNRVFYKRLHDTSNPGELLK